MERWKIRSRRQLFNNSDVVPVGVGDLESAGAKVRDLPSRRSRLGIAAGIAASLLALPAFSFAADKLSDNEKIELLRGLTAEFAKAKDMLPRSKKPLIFNSDGTWDKQKWKEAAQLAGPAARLGDEVKITKISIESDHIVLEINGGIKSGKKWYDHVSVGVGGADRPVGNGDYAATTGTYIDLLFHQPLANLTSADVKKILAPVLDFDKRSATVMYSETLPPEVQKAIIDKKAREGMNREQVLLALGHPDRKYRETKDGTELEDWIFGKPPGRVTFVTFEGSTVVKVKESYAGLGVISASPQP